MFFNFFLPLGKALVSPNERNKMNKPKYKEYSVEEKIDYFWGKMAKHHNEANKCLKRIHELEKLLVRDQNWDSDLAKELDRLKD